MKSPGARRGLPITMTRMETWQEKNNEQQNTCPSLQKVVVGTTDSERKRSGSLAGEDRQQSGTTTPPQTVVIAKLLAEHERLCSFFNNYKTREKNAKSEKMESQAILGRILRSVSALGAEVETF